MITRGRRAGVEHALFEIELPRAALLRHQPPLQPVGEARDDRVEVLQLLVEIFAQALQLVGVAQFVCVNDLVEPGGIGLVVGPALLRGGRLRRAALRGLFRFSRIAFVLELRRRRLDGIDRALFGVVRRVVGRLALHRILALLVLALSLSLVGVFRRRLLVRLLFRFLASASELLAMPSEVRSLRTSLA